MMSTFRSPVEMLILSLSKKQTVTTTAKESKQVLDPGDLEIGDALHSEHLLSASYGSFIHGSEDEFYDIRITAIESMTQIGCRSKQFAELAIPFLIGTYFFFS